MKKNKMNKKFVSSIALSLGMLLSVPVSSFASTFDPGEDEAIFPETTKSYYSLGKYDKSTMDNPYSPLGNGQWDLVKTHTVTFTNRVNTIVVPMNGDGVKVCFRLVSGDLDAGTHRNKMSVKLWEQDIGLDDDYDRFNTEWFRNYGSGTCAYYSGVGGDAGKEELYMNVGDGDSETEKVELKWYD